MLNSEQKIISFLAVLQENDLRTVHGCNLKEISNVMKVEVKDLIPREIKTKMKYRPVPLEDMWRIEYIKELIQNKENKNDIEDFDTDDVNNMINILCTE